MGIGSALCAIVGGALLTGCAVHVDERTAFAPQALKPVDGVDPNGRVAGEDKVGATVEHGFLSGAEGERIAWSAFARAGEDRPLVVHCGGNASDRWRSGRAYASKLVDRADVFLFDYPGYGDSGGSPSAQSFEAMLRLLAPHIDEVAGGRKVVYWGHSLGGFVCARLAAGDNSATGVAFEASAANVQEVADAWDSGFLGAFVRIKVADSLRAYDNVASLRAFKGKILVLAGGEDKTLPPRLSRSLASRLEAAGADVAHIEFEQAGHSTIPNAAGFVEARNDFLDGLPEVSSSAN